MENREKIGCPNGFVDIIRSFHEGMLAWVIEGGEQSDDFDVLSGTKQGRLHASSTATISIIA